MVVKIPKKMCIELENDDREIRPSIKKEEIEKNLGFVFEDISGDDLYYSVLLPSGWSLVDKQHPNYKGLLDQNGFERGVIHYNKHSRDSLDKGGGKKFAILYWLPRYSVHCDSIDKKGKKKIIYFGNKNEKLYIAGMVYSSEFSNYETIDYFLRLAKEYGNNNYPFYNDIFAYWDENIKDLNKEELYKYK